MNKKIFIIIGFIAAILAAVLAVSPSSHLAVIPIIIAFLCGLIIIFISKKQKTKTKTIQYIFLLVIMSLSLTIYKSIFSNSETNTTTQQEESIKKKSKDSKKIIKELEIEENL